jgi:ketosteroid isomerase-like protein
MKNILLSVLLAIVAAASALPQSEGKAAPAKRSVEGQLIELERQLSAALVREDAAVLDRLWSNDLVFTFPNGKVSNKAQRLAGQKPAAPSAQSESDTTNDEVKVYLYGNTAVVTCALYLERQSKQSSVQQSVSGDPCVGKTAGARAARGRAC